MSTRFLRFCLKRGCIVLITILIVAITGESSAVNEERTIKIEYKDSSLSIDVKDARVSEVFKELASRTPYEFIVPEELLEHRVTLKCSGVDLSDGVRRIIKNAGVDNYAVIYSFPESSHGKGSWSQVRVVLMDREIGGKDELYRNELVKAKGYELSPEFGRQLVPVAKNVSVFPKQHISASMLQQVSPKGAEAASTEVPAPVLIAPENEGFPVHRKLEVKQEPAKVQLPGPSS